MKEQVSFCDFTDRFHSHDRQDQFSYEGKRALFDYLEELENDCDCEIELDIIALCCEYTEYESAVDCINDAGYDFAPCDDVDEHDQEEDCLDYLRNNTQVIEFDGGIIIQNF